MAKVHVEAQKYPHKCVCCIHSIHFPSYTHFFGRPVIELKIKSAIVWIFFGFFVLLSVFFINLSTLSMSVSFRFALKLWRFICILSFICSNALLPLHSKWWTELTFSGTNSSDEVCKKKTTTGTCQEIISTIFSSGYFSKSIFLFDNVYYVCVFVWGYGRQCAFRCTVSAKGILI